MSQQNYQEKLEELTRLVTQLEQWEGGKNSQVKHIRLIKDKIKNLKEELRKIETSSTKHLEDTKYITDQDFLEEVTRLVLVNLANKEYWVDQLVEDMPISRSTFFRKIKKVSGQGPNDFIQEIRLKRAAQLLKDNLLSVSEISEKVGFNSLSYFGKCFKKFYGMPPSRYTGE